MHHRYPEIAETVCPGCSIESQRVNIPRRIVEFICEYQNLVSNVAGYSAMPQRDVGVAIACPADGNGGAESM